jgi:hypothetical protein
MNSRPRHDVLLPAVRPSPMQSLRVSTGAAIA